MIALAILGKWPSAVLALLGPLCLVSPVLAAGEESAIEPPAPVLNGTRVVSPKVARRLHLAGRALRFAKMGIPRPGNQKAAIDATQGNSYLRMAATRATFGDPIGRLASGEHVPNPIGGVNLDALSPEAKALRAADPLPTYAAVISCTRGGNCKEVAALSMHYLLTLDIDEPFQYVSIEGLDHAFVLIGDLARDRDDEIVVVDAWVDSPRAVVWADYRFHTPDRSKIAIARKAYRGVGRAQRYARRQVAREVRQQLRDAPIANLTATATFHGTFSWWEVDTPTLKDVVYKTSTPTTTVDTKRRRVRSPAKGRARVIAGNHGPIRHCCTR